LKLQTMISQGLISKSARVSTNDPAQPHVVIGMKGKVRAPIYVKPRVVRLEGVEGDDIGQIISIHGEREEPLVVTISVNSIPDKIDLELKKEENNTYELRVKNKVEKETSYLGKIKLRTNYLDKPEILLHVVGHVRSTIAVKPRVLIFNPLSEKQIHKFEKVKKPTRSLFVFLEKGNKLIIERVDVQENLFKVDINEIEQGKRFELLIEPILEKLKKGLNTDYLKIFIRTEKPRVVFVPIRIKVT
jgi:hypothetical protein